MPNEKTTVEIEGMTCASCASTVKKSLQNDGLTEVEVDYLSGEASFQQETADKLQLAFRNVGKLGYRVSTAKSENGENHHGHHHDPVKGGLSIEKAFFICLVFTIPVVLHMIFPWQPLHSPVFQLLFSLPVIFIGGYRFGRSAWLSLKLGAPNMDVLIALGSSAAFVYSIAGMILFEGQAVHDYLFFETGDTIITLVLLGNLIEHRSVNQTTSAIRELSRLQPETARVISQDASGQEKISVVPSGELLPGNMILVNGGEKIPTDGDVSWGVAEVDEAMISGESLPVTKNPGTSVIGGTTIVSGSLKIKVTRIGKETFLSRTIELVKNAQKSKPSIQKTGDRISNIFVPVVIGIALLTFVTGLLFFQLPLSKSLMNAIAVLVISCPCAMGLATPTAVMVGLGRAARNGILIKGGDTLEHFAGIRTVVFDKTGTLTTGRFTIKEMNVLSGDEAMAKTILYSLEKHSSHPIATSVTGALREYEPSAIHWKSMSEDKGIGVNAWDMDGHVYSAGSYLVARHLTPESGHAIYVLKDNVLIATVDLGDEIKPGVKAVISRLKEMNIHPVMVSGDRKAVCERVAAEVGISEVYSEQLPEQKLERIERFSATSFTAMVGDGINDAPALARATVGVSLSDATQVAIQSSQVILVPGNDLNQLIQAIRVSRHTLLTIKQNLFWALAYNVVAIPMAAVGMLSPMIGAFSMAFSDVVVIGNSLRLKTKKIF